jgi:hypothetical protein
MGKFIDLTDLVYKYWTVLRFSEIRNKRTFWVCQCKCGTIKEVSANNLRQKHSYSCGCFNVERAIETNTTHGDAILGKTRLYKIWAGMLKRCNSNLDPDTYKHYSGKGITVNKTWHDYPIFKEWAITHGYTEDLTIERIDSNKPYSPNNCIWATKIIQARNRKKLEGSLNTYKGIYQSGSKWIARITVNKKLIHLGTYTTEFEAAQVRDNYVKEHKLEGFSLNLI